jgi:hypothetical protein
VVHQVGHAGNRRRGERERLDEQRLRPRRRGRGCVLREVDVVREPDGDAAPGGAGQRALDGRGEIVREVEVVDRDLERVLRRRDEGGERLGRVLGRLAAVGERPELDQGACARSVAL